MSQPQFIPSRRVTPTIWTYKGPEVDLAKPSPHAFKNLETLCMSLGNQSRFMGHTRRRYSVAEHSFHCWAVAPQRYKWAALLHDVHEAITGDMPAPWKVLLPDFCERELAWQEAAAAAFEIEWDAETQIAVDLIDKAMLATELRDLVNRTDHEVRTKTGIIPLSLSLGNLGGCFPDWGIPWVETVRSMQRAAYDDEDSEGNESGANNSEIPNCYQSAGQSFGLMAARRRLAGEIKAKLATVLILDPAPVPVAFPLPG